MADRQFRVVDKSTGDVIDITGVEALAKHAKVPVSEIPRGRLWKYNITSNLTVYEQE